MTELTVLMTVYNGETFLKETVESILSQTYTDFKFLILDNASNDNSREIIRSYNDPRIKLVALPENIGQVAALNKGLDMIDTPLIARMDADDISLPQRFEQQAAFMNKHPQVGVCGSYVISFDGKKEILWQWPLTASEIKVKLLFECCLPHPAVMMRKSLLDKHNLRYNETIGHSFDWELWQRAAEHFELANIPAYLLKYRVHQTSESIKTLHLQEKAARAIDDQTLKRLGLENHPLRQVHRDAAFETLKAKNREPGFLNKVIQWFDALKAANKRKKIYSADALHRFLSQRLHLILKFNIKYRGLILKIFFKQRLYRDVGIYRSFGFIVRVFLSLFGLFRVK